MNAWAIEKRRRNAAGLIKPVETRKFKKRKLALWVGVPTSIPGSAKLYTDFVRSRAVALGYGENLREMRHTLRTTFPGTVNHLAKNFFRRLVDTWGVWVVQGHKQLLARVRRSLAGQ